MSNFELNIRLLFLLFLAAFSKLNGYDTNYEKIVSVNSEQNKAIMLIVSQSHSLPRAMS